MKILFIGTIDFSYHCLEEIINNQGNIVGVLTKEESSFHSDFRDLTPLAEKNDIPLFYIENINSEHSFEIIKKLDPDVIFCFGWSQLINSQILNYPPLGVIGVHPAQLPKNRGRHPLIWALVLGLEKSAVTFFKMDEEADTGNIISQKKFEIKYEDDAGSIYQKIKEIASKQIQEFLPKLKVGTIEEVTQDKCKGNSWRKRNEVDGKIDWRMSSYAIYNLVRALTHPYIGAHCLYQGEKIKIWKVEEVDKGNENIEPGKVLESNENTIIVKTYDRAIRILDHEFDSLPQKGEYLKW